MQKALAWFEKAAHASDTEAQFMAAEMYGGGFGAPQNNVKACMWYQIAHDTMEPRFRDIAQTEIDLLKGEMTAAETAQAEQMAAQWLKNRKAP